MWAAADSTRGRLFAFRLDWFLDDHSENLGMAAQRRQQSAKESLRKQK